MGSDNADAQQSTDLICQNFGDFQEVLMNMRKIDDRIIYALNAVIPTESFASPTDPLGTEQCKKLSNELTESQKQRQQTIRHCVDFAAKRVQDLRAYPENGEVAKNLRREQNSLRMMQSELNVEEVLQDRATKILHDRCKFFLKASESRY
ncbi:putative Coiled-coil domain-containing protein 58 [Hypsibius exemplaris]|uniref:Protein MIX23 n=1 Tax=Hypsibius exemplaris TaxID=2072580 RepID=A0A1W0WAP6_HYPEX|nr:putative Coiled-coil domain-containing protein 58 [Hypsibius exemplaris]